MNMYLTGIIFAIGMGISALAHQPVELKCDYRENPLGVGKPQPGLSWRLSPEVGAAEQSAYQIQVASSAELLAQDKADLWDSEKVVSTSSLHIPYAGKPLRSRQRCYWRVRVWTAGDKSASSWSDIAHWEMALLAAEDWSAKWIRGPLVKPATDSPVLAEWESLCTDHPIRRKKMDTGPALDALTPATWLRKAFVVSKPVRTARLYSTAAGYVEFYLDGKKLGTRLFNPAQTDFEKRILYDVDAVEAALVPGRHSLAAHLGEGFYGQSVAFPGQKLNYGRPSIIAQLEIVYDDGSTETVVSDASWLTHPSPVVKNNVYAGEVFDQRRYLPSWNLPDTAPAGWSPAEVLTNAPTQRLEVQALPTVEAVRKVSAKALLQPEPDVWVFDFGQNFTGFVELDVSRLRLSPGKAVFLSYAEWADARGRISQASGGGFANGVNQVDCYITGREGTGKWRPSFAWHGFRYVEVRGLKEKPELELLTGHLARSAVRRVGTFESSSAHLNRVHQTALWTYESNLVSLPMDCPIRERCGWTGDAHAALTLSNYNFDMGLFWEKYLGDFRTSRHISPCIVPGKRGGNRTPDWSVAQVLVVWEHYLHHGDRQLLKTHYKPLLAFMDHFRKLQKQGIIEVGYGDWCDPVRKPGMKRKGGAGRPQQTPPAKTSSALFIRACRIMQEVAEVLGDAENVGKFRRWADSSTQAFNQRFLNTQSNSYGSQTADAMALCFGIVPKERRAKLQSALNNDVTKNWNGHASVGALGHRWLYPALSDGGFDNTALGTFFAKGHPGFYYLFDELNGTSLWERKGAFDPAKMSAPRRSLSHPFQGGYDAWFFMALGGIRPDPEHPGFKRFVLQPVFPTDLDWVKVSYESGYGKISSSWKRDSTGIKWTVCVPPNTRAKVVMGRKSGRTTLNGNPLREDTLLTAGTHTFLIQ